jgi:hypothetical protein
LDDTTISDLPAIVNKLLSMKDQFGDMGSKMPNPFADIVDMIE